MLIIHYKVKFTNSLSTIFYYVIGIHSYISTSYIVMLCAYICSLTIYKSQCI